MCLEIKIPAEGIDKYGYHSTAINKNAQCLASAGLLLLRVIVLQDNLKWNIGRKYGSVVTGQKCEEMWRATVSVWLIENNGQQFIVAISGCTDARDRILMHTVHHFIQATDV